MKIRIAVFTLIAILALGIPAYAYLNTSNNYIVSAKITSPEGVANAVVHNQTQGRTKKEIKAKHWNTVIPYAMRIIESAVPEYIDLYSSDEHADYGCLNFTRNGQSFYITFLTARTDSAKQSLQRLSLNPKVEEVTIIQ